jgi:hypothetical protein
VTEYPWHHLEIVAVDFLGSVVVIESRRAVRRWHLINLKVACFQVAQARRELQDVSKTTVPFRRRLRRL